MLQHAAPSITVLARLVRHTKRIEHHGQERMQTHSESLVYVFISQAYHAFRPCIFSLSLSPSFSIFPSCNTFQPWFTTYRVREMDSSAQSPYAAKRQSNLSSLSTTGCCMCIVYVCMRAVCWLMRMKCQTWKSCTNNSTTLQTAAELQ